MKNTNLPFLSRRYTLFAVTSMFVTMILALFLSIESVQAAEVAYVTNEADGTLTIIDLNTDTVTGTVSVATTSGPSGIQRIVATPDQQHLYITDGNANEVIVVQTSDNSVVTRIPVTGTPAALDITPDGSKVYVASQFEDRVSVIDTTTNTVTTSIPVAVRPISVAVTPDGSQVYVSHLYKQASVADPKVFIIDVSTDTVTGTISLTPFSRSQEIAITPDGTKAYVAISDSNAVGVLDLTTGTQTGTINGLTHAAGVTIAPDGSTAYVLSSGSNRPDVFVIDIATDTHTTTMTGFSAPHRADITDDSNYLYVPNAGADTVSVVDTQTQSIVTTIPVGDTPLEVEIVDVTNEITLYADKDALLRPGNAKRNEGANPRMSQGNKRRAIVSFDLSGINTAAVTDATLIFSIDSTNPSKNWGSNGRYVGAHRVLDSWEEGNGKSHDLPAASSTRGTGSGVTWSCAVDTNITNKQIDCATTWDGGTITASSTDEVLHTNGMTGEVSFDVTQDIIAGGDSWLLKKVEENKNGNIRYYSKENTVDPLYTPKLVLTL